MKNSHFGIVFQKNPQFPNTAVTELIAHRRPHTVGWTSKSCAGLTLLPRAAIAGHESVPLNLLTIHPQHQTHYQPVPSTSLSLGREGLPPCRGQGELLHVPSTYQRNKNQRIGKTIQTVLNHQWQEGLSSHRPVRFQALLSYP